MIGSVVFGHLDRVSFGFIYLFIFRVLIVARFVRVLIYIL